jgi:hypothetical protein
VERTTQHLSSASIASVIEDSISFSEPRGWNRLHTLPPVRVLRAPAVQSVCRSSPEGVGERAAIMDKV